MSFYARLFNIIYSMKNNKNEGVSAFTIAIFYVGLFIGAGFLSGQELWQYFGKYKGIGLIFLVLGSFLQGYLGYFIVKKAQEKNVYNFCNLSSNGSSFYYALFFISEVAFMFFTASIMIAGASSLYESLFCKSGFWFSMLFIFLVFVTAFFGVDGVCKVFNFAVPLLLIISALIFFLSLNKMQSVNFFKDYKTLNFKSVIGAIYNFAIYVFHNVFLSLALLVPFSKKIKDKKAYKNGFLLSSVAFLIFSLLVLLPILAFENFASFSLPLLEVSKMISPMVFYTFAFFLCVAMFTVCLSNIVGVVNCFDSCDRPFFKNRLFLITAVSIISFIFSRLGFKLLIKVTYPLCGILGIIFIIRLVFCNGAPKIK